MGTSKEKFVEKEYSFACKKCGSYQIVYYTYEPYDEAYTDYHYHCLSCNREWWVEGCDS